MPEAPVDEDGDPPADQEQVRATARCEPALQPEAKPEAVHRAPQQDLRTGVPARASPKVCSLLRRNPLLFHPGHRRSLAALRAEPQPVPRTTAFMRRGVGQRGRCRRRVVRRRRRPPGAGGRASRSTAGVWGQHPHPCPRPQGVLPAPTRRLARGSKAARSARSDGGVSSHVPVDSCGWRPDPQPGPRPPPCRRRARTVNAGRHQGRPSPSGEPDA